MQLLRSKPKRTAEAIVMICLEDIAPNPLQPRRSFDRDALAELADSIRRYGVLSPLAVRCRGDGYELVAGERRLRAARMAGLQAVPCILLDVDPAESGAIALVENLQRRDLDFLEQAQGIARLMELYGLSQEECAARIGKSQSAIANKLRLLRLSDTILDRLRGAGLTERHGRALLRLPETDRSAALEHMIARGMTVAAAETYVESLLEERTEPAPRAKFVLKDVRVFMNSLRRSIDILRQGGIDADIDRQETEREVVVTVHIRR